MPYRTDSTCRAFRSLIALALLLCACGDNIKAIDETRITGFSINGVDASISGTDIALTLPFGTDLTNLTPTITFIGETISPASGVAQDFSDPVAYTVTGSFYGGMTLYAARVDTAPSDAKALTSLAFEAANNPALASDVVATINGTAVTATVPFGTDVTALVATFTTTGASVKVGATTQTSGNTANDFTNPVPYTVTAADASTQLYTVTVTVAPSNAKAITAFTFESEDNGGLVSDVVATISGTSISATVPFGTNVTALVATFSTTGASVTVSAATQVSGITPNDFTSTVQYTVHAADTTTQVYTVTVTIAANSAKAITSFSFLSADNNAANLTADVVAVINGTSISATVPFGTTVTALVASFTTSGSSVTVGGVTQDSGTTPNNFTGSVTYTVHAADTTTQDYTVTVSVAPSTAKDLGPFQFFANLNPGLSVNVTASISGTAITAILPFATPKSSLVASFTTTGSFVTVGTTPVTQDSGVTVNDFTNPVEYTVHAADGSTQIYTVTVINSFPGDKDITQFTILGINGLISGTQISLTVPNGTDLTALQPTIQITGKSVSPDNMSIQDFTNPVTYTVTAFDNTTKVYTVTVVPASFIAKDITRFVVNGLDAIIASTSETTGTITLNMPNGTDLSSLSPIVTITGVSVSPASGVATDFTNNVNYVVTAADGSTKTYVVSIGVVNGVGTKLITSFTILGVEGTITNGAMSSTVTLVLPAGTDLDGQTPTIVINGSSLSPPSRVPQDFTMPVIYTVTAADGSTRVYTVTVTLAP